MAKRKHFEATLTTQKGGQCDEIKVIGNGPQTYVCLSKDGRHVADFGGKALLLKLVDAIQKSLKSK